MHRKYLLLFIVILLVACAPRASQWQKVIEVKTTQREFSVEKLGILPFRCTDPSVGDLVADSVTANLLDSNFVVIERTYLAEIVGEQGLSLTGLTDSSDYRKIGHLVDVDFFVVGTVGLMQGVAYRGFGQFSRGGSYSFINSASARVINVRTGQVVITCSYTLPGGAGNDIWTNPSVVGGALAEAIKHSLKKTSTQ
jgi:hypothetical protein